MSWRWQLGDVLGAYWVCSPPFSVSMRFEVILVCYCAEGLELIGGIVDFDVVEFDDLRK